jgi:XTP/dITP diphosphohydrolase
MVQILSAQFPSLELKTLADYEDAPEPEESGTTYAENATIKAASAASFTGEWSLADDAGLEIEALKGAPGLHSKRFEGEDTPFPQKMARILELLEGVPDAQRTARFRCCISLVDGSSQATGNKPQAIVFEATCQGRIAHEPSGAGGFGYDPIFYLPELGCTMADLTADQKHAISHRGKVLRQLAQHLETRVERSESPTLLHGE